jgi:hypothetical protein
MTHYENIFKDIPDERPWRNINKKAKTQWLKSAISYDNYNKFIKNKLDKFELTYIDLLYISNFKG